MRDPDEIREWLEKAEQDYRGALHLAGISKIPCPTWYVSIVNRQQRNI